MKRHRKFSFQRLRGIISKEFMQMRRDRLTFAMMLGIPLINSRCSVTRSIPIRGTCRPP